MGLGRTKITLFREGEFSAKSGITYYGGSPAAVNTAGEITLCTNTLVNAGTASYVGIFRDSSGAVSGVKDLKTTVFMGPAIVTFQKNSANTNNTSINNDGAPGQTGDSEPYDTSLAWDEADRLFIGTTGLWRRTAATANDHAYGTVLKVGTNYLTVLLYGTPAKT